MSSVTIISNIIIVYLLNVLGKWNFTFANADNFLGLLDKICEALIDYHFH